MEGGTLRHHATRSSTVTRDHLNGFPAAVCAGVAIWCSLGTIGLMGAPSTSARVALLAPWWLLPLSIAAVFAAIRALRLSPREQSPLFGSAIVIFPWLPFPVPPAALLWTGPFIVAVWATVIAGLLAARLGDVRGRFLIDRRRAPIVAAILTLVLYGASAVWLSPILPDGDEPHYLILAQSLIKDGDLRIENNHRRGDYLEYSLNAVAPDYLRRGTNGEIYSIHAPGLAVLVAPAMWLFGYAGVVAFLGLIAASSTALVWYGAYETTGSAASAWFGWACCALTTPFFFQATEVFPDGIAATCLLLGTLPLWDGLPPSSLRRGVRLQADRSGPAKAGRPVLWHWVLSGTSLAILPWLQTRLAVLAIAAAVSVCLRVRSRRQLLAFAVVPIVGAALWFGFFVVVYGTPNPTAPYGPYTQTSVVNLLRGFPGLLFDQQFGLIPNAPVYGFVLVGVLAAALKLRRWGWEAIVLTVPYMTAVGTYQMWWGGTSVPARLLAPITLVLGIAAARVWQDVQTRGTKSLGLLTLVASVVITFTLLGPDHGRLLLNFRDGISLWLDWANDVVDLSKGLPSLFHDDRARLWLKVAIWGTTAVTLLIALRVTRSKGLCSWQSTWCAAAAVMIAFTLAWHVDGAQPLTPETAQVNLLRHASMIRSLAYDFSASRFERTGMLLSQMRIGTDHQRRPASSPTFFVARDLPAGAYAVRVPPQLADGTLTMRVGSTPLPFLKATNADGHRLPRDLAFVLPVRVRSIAIDGDAAVARSAAGVELVPVERAEASSSQRANEAAHRAAHYESADAFFLDDNAYPEPAGFWVAGSRTTTAIIVSREDRLDLFVRNAPVDNHVTIDVDGEVHELTLRPGEEQLVRLTNTHRRSSVRVRITSRNGFRPSTTEPGSTDLRYLGCWVETK